MASKAGKAAFRYMCSDCGSTKEFAHPPAMAPTCCGKVMDQVK